MPILRIVVLPLMLVACATFTRLAMVPLLNNRPLLALFVVPLMIAGYIGGPWSALVGTGVAAWATEVFIMQPTWERRAHLPVDTYEQAILVLAGLAITTGCWLLQREHKRALQGEQRLRLVMNNLGASMFLLLLSPDGRVLEVSQRGYRQSNLLPKDIIGQRLDATYWWTWSPDVAKQLSLALDKAATGVGSRFTTRARIGEELRWVDLSLTPVLNAAGTVAYIVPSGNFIAAPAA